MRLLLAEPSACHVFSAGTASLSLSHLCLSHLLTLKSLGCTHFSLLLAQNYWAEIHLPSGCGSPFCAQQFYQPGPGGQHAARAWWAKAGEQQESPGVPSLCPVGGSALPSAADAAQGRLHSFLAPLLISAQARASLVTWHVQGVSQCASIPCYQRSFKLAFSIFPKSCKNLECSWLCSSFLKRKTVEKVVSARLEVSVAPAGPAQLKW